MRTLPVFLLLVMLVAPAWAQKTAGSTAVRFEVDAADQLADGFGWAVAVQGDEMLVGEPFGSLQAGRAYLYSRGTDNVWRITHTFLSDLETLGDQFGAAVWLGEDLALIGAPEADDQRGAVYVFERQDGSWAQTARLVGTGVVAGDEFGTALDASGHRLLIGAPATADGGVAFLFEHDGTAWREAARLTGTTTVEGDLFGWSVALDGDQALVGAQYHDSRTGAVYYYERDAASEQWAEQEIWRAGDSNNTGRFGRAISLQDGIAAIGAPYTEAQLLGAVYVREQDPATQKWEEVAKLQGATTTNFDLLGWSVDLAEDYLIAGARLHDAAGSAAGTAYIFARDAATGMWQEEAQLTPATAQAGDQYGRAVAAAGTWAVVGGPRTGKGVGLASFFERDASSQTWQERGIEEGQSSNPSILGTVHPCENGQAADLFSCEGLALLSFLDRSEIGATGGIRLNDLWGWVDPETQREYAIAGREDGVSFVDVTDPLNPRFVANLPMTAGASPQSWRDVKVYQNHVYVVMDGSSVHGMQIFDLTRLRSLTVPGDTVAADARYEGFGKAHNIVINEATGYAYAVGTATCGGGLHMIDLRTPQRPAFVGCFADPTTGRSGTGYVHDAQCVIYQGPDADYQGREICFGLNETAISIADVTDKANPVAVATATYPGAAYIHQGWLTDDQRYLFQNDELDETGSSPTRTFVWDLNDLDDPQLLTTYEGETNAIDHNLYILGRHVFASNYTSGLRVLDISDVANPVEIAHFDTYPAHNRASFDGTWSNYPYFPSGNIVVTSRTEGLFMLRATGFEMDTGDATGVETVMLEAASPNPFQGRTTLRLRVPSAQAVTVRLYDALGREISVLFEGALLQGVAQPIQVDALALPSGVYFVRAEGETFTDTRQILHLR